MCVERPDGAFDIYTGRFIQFHQIDNSRRKIVEISDPDLVGMTYSIPMVFNGGKFSGQGVTCLSLPAVTLIKVTFPSRTYQEGQEQITMSSPDQALFSEDVRKNCAGTCVLTGVRGRQRTEAAHIKPRHAGGEPDVTNGILLRSDIHTLFDNWHFSIDPDSMKARFSPDVLFVDKDLLQLEGKQIDFSRLQMPINIEHLRHHWNKFFNRHVNPFIKNALNKKINNYEKRPVNSNIHY
ncbi:TPA: HNH endonuclease [Escherichia coli]|uniref:HNH endonuclease n=3 Tax=Enterobacterales TaxID=91347 RepID=A0A377F5R3_ECOLX|nr:MULTISPECIES: HNH endonuclease signature motif containing protein [Enterobacteriaceae]EEL0900229.1 HNH endonuclease [Salmonella enterica]EFT0968266.1 HNH endonuclease [Salmonella enterica subsp. enterica serovar Senftenberg]EGO0900889.1 HNH endonuclease [Salmonella enterica subsp. enterica serovar 4,5,12:i:-]EHF3317973.1 HNH endonuclease [Salmonella enterica subsp. enterica serovar Idikan]EHF9701537.1 HNH endonuclease [Salmonella enterica subsp. enterica serovar Agona]EHS2501688.1 HNH endo